MRWPPGVLAERDTAGAHLSCVLLRCVLWSARTLYRHTCTNASTASLYGLAHLPISLIVATITPVRSLSLHLRHLPIA